MFRNLGGWLGRMFGSGTEKYYRDRADEAAGAFVNREPPGPDADAVLEPDIELVEFEDSTDIEWMTYNHDTGECIIQFLDHGRRDRVYIYPDLPYEEFEGLREGAGPFPRDRFPYYVKDVSVGQRANYYLRNDHHDDLYEFEHYTG